jgi:uncharacterized protein
MPERGHSIDVGPAEKVAFLCEGRHLAGRPRTVQVIETHFAWVFLAGRWAYKLKKAARNESLDYRTVASREAGCRNELRLNRRLAPRVYVRVARLVRNRDGELALCGAERPRERSARTVDWVVQMRRLPLARMLDHAIESEGIGRRDLERLMRRLAGFFRSARRRPLSGRAYLARLERQVRQNARELRASDLKLDRALLEQIEDAQLELIARLADDLGGRGARLLDGHGDLRPEHVFLGAPSLGACVIDCLEFDADLRRLDPAEEMAFLALECARLGAGRLGAQLIERYRHALADPVPEALIQFYMSRRAAVRAQIAAWHLRDAMFAAERPAWRALARSYLAAALQHARAGSASVRIRAPRAAGAVRGAVEYRDR